MNIRPAFAFVCGLLAMNATLWATDKLGSELQLKIDERVTEIKAWAATPVLVKAVVDHAAKPPADHLSMSQEKWALLSVLDPTVRSLSHNPAALFLRSKSADWLNEAFLSDAQGAKVAFLSKPTSWSHLGKPKHELPMSGKIWQGPLGLDQSTGLQQIQVAVPVLQAGVPVGSLVVGLSVAKL